MEFSALNAGLLAAITACAGFGAFLYRQMTNAQMRAMEAAKTEALEAGGNPRNPARSERRAHYEKPSEKRARQKAESLQRSRAVARERAQREGLPSTPKTPAGVH